MNRSLYAIHFHFPSRFTPLWIFYSFKYSNNILFRLICPQTDSLHSDSTSKRAIFFTPCLTARRVLSFRSHKTLSSSKMFSYQKMRVPLFSRGRKREATCLVITSFSLILVYYWTFTSRLRPVEFIIHLK